WAFQAPKQQEAPAVKGAAWTRGKIDRFILARLEEKNLKPVHDAGRAALLRRATFDLTGLPPTLGEIDAFAKDKSKNAFAKIVDRLLASERFGERWGRHWLDVARYAESMGRTRNYPFPVAWRYRDYVIQAFNQDKPYDQFIREQVAGDLLPAGTPEEKREKVIATGFLAMGAHDLNEADRAQSRMDIVDEQVTAVSRAFVGLTVNCARCHDHKFDPIPTKDYYALAGIFGSTEMLGGLRVRPQFNAGYYSDAQLLKLDGLPAYTIGNAEEITRKRAEILDKTARLKKDRIQARQLAREFGQLPIPENLAMGARDASKPVNFQVNIRGDAHTLGEVAPRNFVQALYEPAADLPKIPDNGSGRLQLAEWLTRRDNPLTARVMANRVWHQLFGRGLVATVDNFGKMGSRPTHPELLDYLAVQFMDQGWSVKKLIREVMLSRAYQLSIDHDEKNFQIEPDNDMLWRANRRRLEVEALRDSMLLVSGQLDLKRPEASPVYRFPLGNEINRGGGKAEPWDVQARYRSVYVPVLRNAM
ncbi:MAG: DUF1549 and DUF1553 domain-containing protein, partial [Bryobacteraceae bacterium]